METPFAAYVGDEPCIFVCYAHEDSETVYPEISWLRDQGFNIWYDEGISAGKNWRAAIGEALLGASHVLFYISARSLKSDHCNREINLALDEGKDVVPVYIEDVELTTDLKVGLNRVQALHRNQDASYQQHLLNALGQASRIVEQPQTSPRKPPPWRPYAISALVAVLLWAGWWYLGVNESVVADGELVNSTDAPLAAIAILPFDDLSPGGDQAWLGSGMAEALTESLSRIDGLRIPGRISTAGLKQQGSTAKDIGRQLGVGSIVSGSVRREGQLLNIVVQWVRVDDESHLWTARYERSFEDVFDIQQEIAVGIAEAIRTQLGVKDALGVLIGTRYEPADPRAWESVRRAIEFNLSETSEGYAKSFEHCRRAIAIDPDYAQAYSCLAWSYYHWVSPERDVARGVELAKRAVQLNPTDVMANNLLAFEELFAWDVKSAEARLVRSLEAYPNQVFTNGVYLPLLTADGRFSEALERAEEGATREPLMGQSQAWLASALFYSDRWDDALARYEKALSISGFNAEAHGIAAFLYEQAGRSSDAVDALLRVDPELNASAMHQAYDAGGWQGINRYMADAFAQVRSGTACYPWGLAQAGAREGLYACLEQMLSAPYSGLFVYMQAKAIFGEYWDEPRFKALKKRYDAKIQGKDGKDLVPLTAIAVLPFDDLSPAGDQRWLATGMAENLIESLSRIGELKIPGRTSAASLKQQGATLDLIGEKLNVGTVVEGSIRRQGEQINVVARWIRVVDESLLWSARYDSNLDDVFEVQRSIAVDIAEAIRSELGIKDTLDSFMKSRYEPKDIRAWELYTKAFFLWNEWTPDAFAKAAELCRQAISIDPQYSEAYSCLANVHYFDFSPLYDYNKAIQLAERAVELDPYDDLSNWTLTRASMEKWDFATAESRAKRVLAAEPRSTNTLAAYLQVLTATGRHDEALVVAQQIAEREPLYAEAVAQLGVARLYLEDYLAASEVYEKATNLGEIHRGHYFFLAYAYRQLGRPADAVNALVKSVPDLDKIAIRQAYERGGWKGVNLFIAENLTLVRPQTCFSYHLAQAEAKEELYACLEQQLAEKHMIMPAELQAKVVYKKYWNEPRFQESLINLKESIREISKKDVFQLP